MPIPSLPNGGQSALERYAIQHRNVLIPINIYNSDIFIDKIIIYVNQKKARNR